MGQLAVIKISEIRENPVALRTVNQDSEQFMGLVESIRQKGFLGAITVRQKVDEETKETYYELVDGLQRYTAAIAAGLEEINVDIVSLEDSEVLMGQIMLNIHKVETRPMEYTKQLRRILLAHPLMIESELAASLGKSTQWIKERLGLNRIDNNSIATLVNSGKIPLANAYALAKLPSEEMPDWVERAMTEAPAEFIPKANKRIKEINEARRKGREAGPEQFTANPHLRKVREVKDEMESGEVGTVLLSEQNITDAHSAFALAVQWVLCMDPKSQEAQKQKFEQRQAEKAEEAKQRKAEKTKKDAAKKREAAKRAEADAKEAAEAANTVPA
jgi:ParB/RepB/Spo0J family partition protein